MVENKQSRVWMNLKTGDDSTQHYDDATFKRLFLNDFATSESKEILQPLHQDNSNCCESSSIHNNHSSDHSHSSCNSNFGSNEYGSSSGSDYSSTSSSSSDY